MNASLLPAPVRLPAFERALWHAVAPTLERVGILQPPYAMAFEGLIEAAGLYFRLRQAVGALPVRPSTERELRAWRALLLRQCAQFGLRRYQVVVRDAVDVRAADEWLDRVFGVNADLLAKAGDTKGWRDI